MKTLLKGLAALFAGLVACLFGFVVVAFVAGKLHDTYIGPQPEDTTAEMIERANTHAASIGRNPPKPFTYDGCTRIPETLYSLGFTFDLNSVCLAHDVAYWAGGTEAQRNAADRALYEGVKKEAHWILAEIMYFAVDQMGDTGLAKEFTGRNWGHGYNDQ